MTTARMPIPESVRLLRAAVPTPFQPFVPTAPTARARSVRAPQPPPPSSRGEVWSTALLMATLVSAGAGVTWLVSVALFP